MNQTLDSILPYKETDVIPTLASEVHMMAPKAGEPTVPLNLDHRKQQKSVPAIDPLHGRQLSRLAYDLTCRLGNACSS